MNTRYCCICARPGHHSHKCPDGPAFRQQWNAQQEAPKEPELVDGALELDEYTKRLLGAI